MKPSLDRRTFLSAGATTAAAGLVASTGLPARATRRDAWFEISLAEWSLHRTLRGGDLDNLGFPAKAKSLGIGAVEYVNSFFKDKAQDLTYLRELRQRCDDAEVKSLLIMCDGEGHLGAPDQSKRQRAVENHYRWVAAAKLLDCHSIRVNAASSGSWEEQRDRAADGLHRLAEFGQGFGIHVIVENHGGLSSNGRWLAEVMKQVDHPFCGTLPDFGNFRVKADDWYDRYQGVAELMPFAQAVSAKSHDFDEDGNETRTDYGRMLGIVKDAGYRGFIGIEYEGGKLGEDEGIRATKALLERHNR